MSPAPARPHTTFPAIAAVCAVISLGFGGGAGLFTAGVAKGELVNRVVAVEATAREAGDLRTRVAVTEAKHFDLDRRLERIEAKLDKLLGAAGAK
jgi:hypothetical protein